LRTTSPISSLTGSGVAVSSEVVMLDLHVMGFVSLRRLGDGCNLRAARRRRSFELHVSLSLYGAVQGVSLDPIRLGKQPTYGRPAAVRQIPYGWCLILN